MKNFLNNLNKDLGSLAEVNHFNLQFKGFKLIRFDSPWGEKYKALIEKHPDKKEQLEIEASKHEKEWYLMGVDGIKSSREHRFTDPKVLISLINLGLKIDAHNGLVDENGQMDEFSFSEEIINWCKEFGLPYVEEYFQQNYCKDKGSIPPLGYCGFRLWEFKRRIALLSDYFNLWYGLAFDDMRKIIKYSKRVQQIDLNKDLDAQVSLLKESLAYTVWADMKTEISLRYNKKTDTYEIVPYTDSLVAVAYFQFAMLMTNKGANGVKFCSMCNDLFEVEHGSVKICGNCKRDYHRIKTKESRERKKRKNKTSSPF